MKKHINLKVLVLGAILVISTSCNTTDVDQVITTDDYPIATFEVIGDTNVGDREDTIIRVKINTDKTIKRPVYFDADQIGGTAILHEDFDILGVNLLGYSNEAYLDIIVYGDLDIEGDETIELKIVTPDPNNRHLLNPTTIFPTISITIKDYAFCLWNLDARDTYGDGWNGAYIRLESEGSVIDYFADGLQSLFSIPVTVGADYTFTYVSGGGMGGAPGYEVENYYLLTSPDGITWEDGTTDYSGMPTPGLITSGTQVSCD